MIECLVWCANQCKKSGGTRNWLNKLIMPYPTLLLPPLAFPSSSLPPPVNYFHSSQQCIPLGIAPSPTNNRSTGEPSRLRSFVHGPHSSWSSLVSSPHPHNQREEGSQSIFSRDNPLNYSNTYTFDGLNGLIRLLYPLNVICLKLLCSAVAN